MPMGDLDSAFPKKSRYDNLNFDGLTADERVYYTKRYNSYITAGYSPAEAIAYTNDEIYKAQQEALIEAETKRYAEQKQLTEPRPAKNLSGDVTVRRMTQFLMFMNEHTYELSNDQVIEAIENEWSDVIDVPITVWDSDVYGLVLYLIGGGRIVPNLENGTWLYLSEEPETKPLNTLENHSDNYE
jgi:hypothetical protein